MTTAKTDLNDLTQGNVTRQLIRFGAPFMLSNLIQSLYNIADMLIVQWFVGAEGSAAVGIGGQITQLVTSLVIGFSAGSTILIAQYTGAGRKQDVKETIGTLFTLFFIVAVICSIGFIVFTRPLLRLLQTPEESFESTVQYVVICMMGTVFIYGYNAVSAILRGMGDSKRPLYFVSVACVVNVVLDVVFVKGLSIGVPGSALATVLSQAVSLVLSIVYLCKHNFIFDFKRKSFKIYPQKLKAMLRISLPTAIQNSVTSLSFLAMTAIINQFGYAASAAANLTSKFNNITILPSVAMSAAIAAMSGQNIGAGKPERAKKCYHVGTVLAMGLGAVAFVLTFVCAPQITNMLSGGDAAVNQSGVPYMQGFCADYIFVAFMFCTNGLINGSGHTTITLVTNLCAAFFMRIPLAYLLGVTLNWGMLGLGLSVPCASIIGGLIGLWYLRSGKWKTSSIQLSPDHATLPEPSHPIKS